MLGCDSLACHEAEPTRQMECKRGDPEKYGAQLQKFNPRERLHLLRFCKFDVSRTAAGFVI